MTRGTTPTFILKFASAGLELSTIKSYCLAFGKTERKKAFDIQEERVIGPDESSGMTEISFKRAKIEVSIEGGKRKIKLSVRLTEEESTIMKAGDAYIQLRIGLTTGDVFASNQVPIEVKNSLCVEEMDDHE